MTDQETPQIPILSRLRPAQGATHSKKRRGRGVGSGLGKTSGKGMKGQKARMPGGISKLHFEGGQTPLERRLPKFGFKNPFTKTVVAINVETLGSRFEAGSVVNPEALVAVGLAKGSFDRVKILGQGNLEHALTIHAHAFSSSAKEKIESAGGTVVPIEDKVKASAAV